LIIISIVFTEVAKNTVKQFFSDSEKRTGEIAREISEQLAPGTVVAFSGGLGAGKTAFVRGAIRAFGNESFVSSPTFALVHDYGGNPHIYHFDMYRVNGIEDLYSTGFFDYLDTSSILFIEWSENISGILPDNTVYIDIEHGENENDRIITVKGGSF